MAVTSRHDGADVASPPSGLSLAAELFLIAIDPASGRLVKRRRRHFRKALATAYGGPASRARRAAVRELRAVGFIERSGIPGRHIVVPGPSSRPFARLRRCIVYDGFESPRDIQLFALLAWSGVLASRLARSERHRAQRRLRALLAMPAAHHNELGPIQPIAAAIGSVAFREEMDVVWEMVGDLVGGDPVTFDGGGGDGGGGGGGDGGGT